MLDPFYITMNDELIKPKPKNELEECMSFILESSNSSNFKNELKSALRNNKITGSKLKDKLIRFLAHSPESLASDIPTVMDVISFAITVIAPSALHPLIGLFSLVATRIIRDAADAKVIGKYISTYNLQISNVEKKIENADSNTKEFWKSIKKDLETGRDNMMNKKEDLRNLDPTGSSEFLSSIDTDESASLILLETTLNLSMLQKAEFWNDSFEDNMIDESVKDVKMKVKQVKKSISSKEQKMDKWFDDTLKDIRNNLRNEKRSMIVQNDFPKLSKLIKRAIVLGTGFAINPAIAAIGLMTTFVLSKKSTHDEKKKLLLELNRELEITNEKIRDADSNGDKKEKYELMRLKHKIETNIDKIKGYL